MAKKNSSFKVTSSSSGGVTPEELENFQALLKRLAEEQNLKPEIPEPTEPTVESVVEMGIEKKKKERKTKSDIGSRDDIVVVDRNTGEESKISPEVLAKQGLKNTLKNGGSSASSGDTSFGGKVFDFMFPQLSKLINAFESQNKATEKRFDTAERKNASEIGSVAIQISNTNKLLTELTDEQTTTTSLLEKLLEVIKKGSHGSLGNIGDMVENLLAESGTSSLLSKGKNLISGAASGVGGFAKRIGSSALATGANIFSKAVPFLSSAGSALAEAGGTVAEFATSAAGGTIAAGASVAALTGLGLYKARNTPEGIAETQQSFRNLEQTAKGERTTQEAFGDLPSPSSPDVSSLSEEQAKALIQSYAPSEDIMKKWMDAWRLDSDAEKNKRIDALVKRTLSHMKLSDDDEAKEVAYGYAKQHNYGSSFYQQTPSMLDSLENHLALNIRQSSAQNFAKRMGIEDTDNLQYKMIGNIPVSINGQEVPDDLYDDPQRAHLKNMKQFSEAQSSMPQPALPEPGDIPPSAMPLSKESPSASSSLLQSQGNNIDVNVEDKKVGVKASEIKFSADNISFEQNGVPLEELQPKPATPQTSEPSTGAQAIVASTQSEMSARSNATPNVSVNPIAMPSAEPMPGLGSVQFPLSKDDPGNLEPADSAERYKNIFDL